MLKEEGGGLYGGGELCGGGVVLGIATDKIGGNSGL